MKYENNECHDKVAMYAVEEITKDNKVKEVVEDKEKEIENHFHYDIFEEIEGMGQEKVGSHWVIARKEKADGQKEVYKGRLVTKGF